MRFFLLVFEMVLIQNKPISLLYFHISFLKLHQN
nr:MAG TPA: hypothetical protein [Bacteriophage sp.]